MRFPTLVARIVSIVVLWTGCFAGPLLGREFQSGAGATAGYTLSAAATFGLRSARVVRGPYLQCGTSNSIVVRWRTDKPTASVVYFALQPAAPKFAATAPGLTTEHIVLLSGLQPATKYVYSLGGGANHVLYGPRTNFFFITAPLADAVKPIRVWVIGDSGTRRLAQYAVRDAYYRFSRGRHTDVWLTLGDNAYNEGRDVDYQDTMFYVYADLFTRSVCWPTLGNHDSYSASSASQAGVYYDIFTLPTQGQAGGVMSGTEAYYSFDYGNAHFICLNSADVDRSATGRMLNWLKEDLAANRRDWTIAYWHHPPYSKGEHDSDREILGDTRLTEMRTNTLPILEAGGVDLVLGGHSHSYERSFLLDGHYDVSTTLTPAMKKNAGNGRLDGTGAYFKPTSGPAPHEGTVYVVAGSSGHLSPGLLNHPAMFISAMVLGSLVLDINGPRLDATFITDTGARLDYFTIVKGNGTPGTR